MCLETLRLAICNELSVDSVVLHGSYHSAQLLKARPAGWLSPALLLLMRSSFSWALLLLMCFSWCATPSLDALLLFMRSSYWCVPPPPLDALLLLMRSSYWCAPPSPLDAFLLLMRSSFSWCANPSLDALILFLLSFCAPSAWLSQRVDSVIESSLGSKIMLLFIWDETFVRWQ